MSHHARVLVPRLNIFYILQKFIVQFGEFAVQQQDMDAEEEESCILRAGDMIEINKGK